MLPEIVAVNAVVKILVDTAPHRKTVGCPALLVAHVRSEAEETGKTIKDLKEEIKGFRESLENAEIGSDDFKSALEQLTNAQNELKQATKSSIDVVEEAGIEDINGKKYLKYWYNMKQDSATKAIFNISYKDEKSDWKEATFEILYTTS